MQKCLRALFFVWGDSLTCEQMTEAEKQVLERLDGMGIAYEAFVHRPAHTSQQGIEIDAELGIVSTHCKNLFLTDRKQSAYFLFLLRADKRFATSQVSKQAGSSRLQFADADSMKRLIRCEPGAASPFGLLFAQPGDLRLLVDRSLYEAEKLCFTATTNTRSILIAAGEFFGRYIQTLGWEAQDIEA